ncbi:MAG TPA: 3-dehydroquinate synthase [Saprospiraceae bacterium]|jgi:3-dehydroquinate synthase|nr:3-dehydroquinate synthase [Candidatus Parvibacillus calidus]HPB53909.1 3-dehydroquinate synthase [Saprospiraceae bacterium]HQP76712.1 3-dehydroquinate synthase [Saprospiraceae bacterium]HRN32985.1 3-dehydroquinate synthase [Saprospiraceae bacterium]
MRRDIIHIDGSPLYLDAELAHLKNFLTSSSYSFYVVIADENTHRLCFPKIKDILPSTHSVITFPSGEKNKNLHTCESLWRELLNQKIDRKALAILLGGGVTGDMGGFIASAYKRGIDFIHVPTTLMAMTDSSIGGKLGIDFDNIKNAIGLFHKPKAIFIHTPFLSTLPDHEMWSGFSEIVKHALIADNVLFRLLPGSLGHTRPLINHEILYQSILVKKTLVERDPLESSVRKALNFGHTIGHAIESAVMASGNVMTHGEAVALGMIVETYISFRSGLILKDHHDTIQSLLGKICNPEKIGKIDRSCLSDFILNDKKNESGRVLFSLLTGIGSFSINKDVPPSIIEEGLDYLYRWD